MPRKMSTDTKLRREMGVIDLEAPWTYTPWIKTKELFGGNGRRHIVNDLKYPDRQIHLMSDLEYETYHILRTNQKVIELFEQYPLKLGKTIYICNELGIIHPRIPVTGDFAVMTTDFLAIIEGKKGPEYRAYAVKMSDDLKNDRILEKLKIEQCYWSAFGVPWALITEIELKSIHKERGGCG